MRNYIAPAAKRAGIAKHINWHVFRHTFSTLLAENDEDVKTVQSLMRHANSNITMNIYTHAVSSKKRRAQSRPRRGYQKSPGFVGRGWNSLAGEKLYLINSISR